MKQYRHTTILPYSQERILGGDLRRVYTECNPFYRDMGYLEFLDRKPASPSDFQELVLNIKSAEIDQDYLEQLEKYCEQHEAK